MSVVDSGVVDSGVVDSGVVGAVWQGAGVLKRRPARPECAFFGVLVRSGLR